ncbi:PKD domain-containing protein [Bacteroidota bacterium]
MKKFLFFFTIILVSFQLFGQTSGGPDAYGYTWKNSNHSTNPPVFGWFDISVIGSEVIGLADDNIVGPFTASSGFQFYWYPVPQFWIGSNGYISFAGNNIASPFPDSIPMSGGANNWIGPLLSDLNFADTNNPAQCFIYYNVDTLCISYVNVPYWVNATPQYTGSNTFQMILNKSDNSITFNYLSCNLGTLTALDVDNISGIENNTGTLGLDPFIDLIPTDSFTVKFYYPDTVTYAVTDGGINWNYNDKNAGVFIKKGASYTLKSNVKNTGNQTLGNFTLRDTVYLANNAVVTSGNATVPPLAVGMDTTLTFSNTLTPPFTGTYKFNSRLSGITGDMVASNNYLQQEIVVIDTTATTMTLEFSDGTAEGNLGWNGGNGGVATYFQPPFYPAKIVSSRFYIASNAAIPVGFYAIIYDNTGPNGTIGNQLDSVYVAGSTITTSAYKVVTCANNNIIINSGGVYLLWYMEAADIRIGSDETPPFSRRTYEVISGGWAEYRDNLNTDFLMGINIQKVVTAPVADFSFDVTNDPQVSFMDLSANNPGSWLWDFDDSNTSGLQNPTHTYLNNGSYHVCLTATNSGGSDSICKTITITNIIPPPIASFSIDSSLMPIISFSDLSTNSPISWLWDFDDTGNDTASVQNPVYEFKSNGNHNVCLIATNGTGSSTPFCYNLLISGVVGMEEYVDDLTFKVYPNPVNQNAILQISSSEQLKNAKLKIINVLGEEIINDYSVNSNVIEINCNHLSKGTYFFDIFDRNEKLGTGKFIVQ